jgi:heme A synthase
MWVGAALLAVYVQIVLGALVRHTGAGLACNVDLIACNGSWWPADGPGMLHMLHRIWGFISAALVCKAAWQWYSLGRQYGVLRLQWFAVSVVGVIGLQILFGFLTVSSYIAVPMVTAHLGGASLLLMFLLILFLCAPLWLEEPHTASVPKTKLKAVSVGS